MFFFLGGALRRATSINRSTGPIDTKRTTVEVQDGASPESVALSLSHQMTRQGKAPQEEESGCRSRRKRIAPRVWGIYVYLVYVCIAFLWSTSA